MNCQTPDFILRKGIVMSKEKCPFDAALTFNAGVAKYRGGYVMLFRNDHGFCRQDFADFYAGISDNTEPKINLGLAFSGDGVHWETEKEPVTIELEGKTGFVYDPRITDFGNGEYGICFAVSDHGTRGGIAVTRDFRHFDVKSVSVPENRNMVLFPEKINGMYCRLERPFLTGKAQRHSIWLSYSSDLVHWGESKLTLSATDVPFCNSKIGPAAPPVKTPEGWLTLFHAVEEVETPFPAWQRNWKSRYYGGAMLLDLDNPEKILAMAHVPLLVPEEPYELDGFRGSVIFPGGLIPEPDGTLKIYYGAADTVECLAETRLDDMISFIKNNSERNEG